jgi:hypothetical protein
MLVQYTFVLDNPLKYVDPWGLEKIVVSGGAFHVGESVYQYEFVDSALLQISLIGDDATFVLSNAGWTAEQYDAIVAAVNERNIKLVSVANVDELTNYINSGNIYGSGDRKKNLISDFYVFAHGTDHGTGHYAIELGLYSGGEVQAGLSWSIDDIYNIDSNAFRDDYFAHFYSCRTGNSFKYGNFAQKWADHTDGYTYAYKGMFGLTSVGRSNYANINGSKIDKLPGKIESILGNNGIFNPSKEYAEWLEKRGPVELKPMESFRLPEASYLTTMTLFWHDNVAPLPAPGPHPTQDLSRLMLPMILCL